MVKTYVLHCLNTPMSNPLSPAAQAVWAAYLDHSEMDETPADLPALAAALRALADQAGSAKHWHVNEIRSIAAELETND